MDADRGVSAAEFKLSACNCAYILRRTTARTGRNTRVIRCNLSDSIQPPKREESAKQLVSVQTESQEAWRQSGESLCKMSADHNQITLPNLPTSQRGTSFMSVSQDRLSPLLLRSEIETNCLMGLVRAFHQRKQSKCTYSSRIDPILLPTVDESALL